MPGPADECAGLRAGASRLAEPPWARRLWDFWASWCTPINLDHDQADAQRFLRMFKPNFPVIFDPAGTLAQRFNVMAMPTSVLIDRTGKIRYEHAGFLLKQRAEYERQIRDLLAQK